MPQLSAHEVAADPMAVEIPAAAETARGPRGPRGQIRDRICSVAREAFVEDGYDGVTIREVARLADCDPAMITYYFGSKQGLFRQCFDLPLDPAREVLQLLFPDPSTAGERIVRHALKLYEEHLTAERLSVLMRALMTDAATSQRFREYIRSAVLDKVTARLGGGVAAAQQLELAMAQLYGLATMRYVVRLEPLASMPRERIVAELAPYIQFRIDRALALGRR